MVKNYLKIAIRSLLKNKVYAFLNIFGLTIGLTLLALPQLNAFTGKELAFKPIENVSLGMALIGITLFVGVLSGSYPAFVLSRFNPTQTLKSNFKTSSKGIVLRKGLVVVQFLISIVLIISTMIVFNQLDYMRDMELGFEKERVIFIPTRYGTGTTENFQVLKDRLERYAIHYCRL